MNFPGSNQDKPKTHQPINYGEFLYWNDRYIKAKDTRFQWLQNFQSLKPEIEKCLNFNKESRILNIGCGNSQLADHLYQYGYHFITSNDISEAVIEQMNKVKAQKQYEHMIYEVMDVRQMSYPDNTFDLVIDKSTIDTLMCSENPILNVAKMVEESYRVLKPGGIYFAVSFAEPFRRLEHLTRGNIKFQIETKTVKRKNVEGGELMHYLYICRKMERKPMQRQERMEFYNYLKQLEEKEYPPA